MSRAADIAASQLAQLVDRVAEAEEVNAQLFAHAKQLEQQAAEQEAKATARIAELERQITKLKMRKPPEEPPDMAVPAVVR